ncbi:MAG: hypothetical protein JKY70_03075, partial [Mucilaginibacter sp.]|nr:hypothetical protein [Mucilaginibacter sp.]
MKRPLQILLVSSLLLLGACKKSEQPVLQNHDASAALSTSTGLPRLSVITIAGKYNDQGFADGQGQQARFEFPYGIDIAEDGNLYVADLFNNAIRKVTPEGNVTTVKIPPSNDGQTLTLPKRVIVSKDGTLNILAYYDLTPASQHKLWILKPNGELTTPSSQVNYYTYIYHDIARDPFSNYLLFCGERYVTGHSGLRQGYI